MKILLSGSTGFVGSHLVKRLKKSGHEVSVVGRMPAQQAVEELTILMRKEKFDGIIHLASLFVARHAPEDIANLVESNVFFGTALLEAAVRSATPDLSTGSPLPWFINTGTFWQHNKNKKYSPVNLYAATKQAFEDVARYYVETFGIDFVTIKLSDTFGPGDSRQKILNLWMRIAASGETLDMSPGGQMIDISYIDNVIDGYERMVALLSKDTGKKLRGKSFAIRSGETMTLKKLASVFERASGKKLRINWGAKDYRSREVMVPWNMGKKIPGWKPRISSREGIEKYFDHEQRHK